MLNHCLVRSGLEDGAAAEPAADHPAHPQEAGRRVDEGAGAWSQQRPARPNTR